MVSRAIDISKTNVFTDELHIFDFTCLRQAQIPRCFGFSFYSGQSFSSIFRGNLNAASAACTQKGPTKMDYRCVNFHRAAHDNGIGKVQHGML